MNWVDFHFIRPYWLFALLPYLAVLIFLLRRKLNRGNWSSVCDAELLPYLLQDKAVKQSRWPLLKGALAGLISILAMAGPTWQRLPTPVFRNDSALVIALDLSHSMDAADVKPNRLTLARYKIADILKRRKDGQTALLVFADDAFVVTPLTNDNQTIDSQLSALSTSIMPNDGNNIARALEKAKALFQQAGLQQGQILLITDGGDLPASIVQAKSLESYQLLVLGVGTEDGAPISLPTGGFLKDEQGGIIVDKLDAPSLEKLAQAGQGAYQSLTPDDADIQALLSVVGMRSQQKGERPESLVMEQWRDNGPWLLLLVLPLAALSFRKGLLSVAVLILLPLPKNSYAFEWQDLWQTKDQQAQEAYQQGDFNKASELFENQDWKAAAHYKTGAYDKTLENLKSKDSANSYYNQGNALAQSGQLQQALDAYDKALKLKPNDDDTLYNKELVKKELEKQKQQNQQQDQQNKDKKEDSKENKENKDQKQNKEGDKSGQPGQDKKDQPEKEKDKQENQQQQDEEKPEAKPEQSQESTENQPEKKDEKENKEQDNKSETAKQQPAQEDEAKQDDSKKDAVAQQAMDPMSKEEQQAHEQWLKRIPDDPAGLLKRKFKYQYDQRERQ